VVFVPDKTVDGLVNPKYIVKIFGLPCKKVIGLVDIESGERRGIMERLDIAFADNGTNGNISTLHDEIEGVGVGSFLLDSMRPRL
jgi:hypothetical protein